MSPVDVVWKLLGTIVGVFLDLLTFLQLTLRTPQAVAAENLFLRTQLALYVERKTKPHRATDAVRFTLAQLSRFFEWRDALTVVKPDTLIRWHRKGFRLFWKWKSQPAGRPRVPVEVRKLIAENGGEQSDMGRGTDRRRALVEDRHSNFPANGPALYADGTEASRNDFPTLDDVRAESCQSDHRV